MSDRQVLAPSGGFGGVKALVLGSGSAPVPTFRDDDFGFVGAKSTDQLSPEVSGDPIGESLGEVVRRLHRYRKLDAPSRQNGARDSPWPLAFLRCS